MIEALDEIEARLDGVRLEVLELIEQGYRDTLAAFLNGSLSSRDIGEPSRDGVEGGLR